MQHACKNDPPVSTKIAKMEPTSPLLSSGLHTNSNRVPESNVSRLLDRLLTSETRACSTSTLCSAASWTSISNRGLETWED